MTVLDGKKLANKIIDGLKQKIQKLDIKPSIAVILANDNPASKIYVKNKEKKALELGCNSYIYSFDENVKEDEIISLIEKLNKDKNINAILAQLPLFKHLDEQKILNTIEPVKDVDGFTIYNTGCLAQNAKPYSIPCTPKGIIKLLKEYNIKLDGKNIVVIGRSNIVGKPLSLLLLNENATVTMAHSKTKNLKEVCLKADIIISATGQKNLIKADMIKKDAIVVDVGISRNSDNKITGDVDFENVKNKASYITPVPGGIGPMTIACLIENTYELFLKQNCLEK